MLTTNLNFSEMQEIYVEVARRKAEHFERYFAELSELGIETYGAVTLVMDIEALGGWIDLETGAITWPEDNRP